MTNKDDVAAFGEEHLFNELWLIIDDTAKSRKVEKVVKTNLQQAKRDVLDAVEARGPGNNDQPPIITPTEWLEGNRAGYQQANTEWHQAIHQLRGEIK